MQSLLIEWGSIQPSFTIDFPVVLEPQLPENWYYTAADYPLLQIQALVWAAIQRVPATDKALVDRLEEKILGLNNTDVACRWNAAWLDTLGLLVNQWQFENKDSLTQFEYEVITHMLEKMKNLICNIRLDKLYTPEEIQKELSHFANLSGKLRTNKLPSILHVAAYHTFFPSRERFVALFKMYEHMFTQLREIKPENANKTAIHTVLYVLEQE